MALSKDTIRNTNDRRFCEVDVPEWGGTVRIGNFSVRVREEIEADMLSRRKGDTVITTGLRAKIVTAAAVDDDGSRLFTDDDQGWLSEKDATVMERIANAALDHNGMSEGAVDAAKGNSEGGPGGASSTGSPSVSGAPSVNSESS